MFCNLHQTSSSPYLPSVLENSYYRSQARVMKSWSVADDPSSLTAGVEGRPIGGTAIGSKDGTVYLFIQSRPAAARVEPHPPESQLSRPTSPLLRESRATSRSSTPSGSSPAPFNVSPLPRIVSAVNTEQVEAYKNYVDYDDEPEKLKDMLRGRSPRGNKGTPNGFNVNSRSPPPSLLEPPNVSKKRSNVKPSLSIPNSISPSPRGRSFSVHELTLWCHILPPRSGPGNAVTSIRLFDRNESIAVLQEMGDLSIFSLQDGSCLATINAGQLRIKPPDGIKDRDVSHDVLVWSHLEVYHVGESTILLASASVDPDIPSSSTLDADDNGVLEKSQLAMFEYATDELATIDVRLVVLGQWYFDGPAHGVGVHQESDHTSMFFSITPEGHFVVRKLRLLPRVPALMEVPASDTHPTNLPSLPLPNPFKAMKPRHDQTPLSTKDRVTGRIAVDEEDDLGELLPGGSLSGLRTLHTEDRLSGIAWSPQQLTAFYYNDGSLRVLFVDPVVDVKNLEWIDDLSYMLLFEDRVDHYMMKTVDPKNNHVDATVASSRLMKPERIRSINIGAYNAADITSTSDILTAVTTNEGCKLTRFDATRENGKPCTLWHTNTRRQELSPENEVTSRLPLELDIIIEGYADGRIRQSSLIEMCVKSQPSSRTKISTQALRGYITGLHVVYHPLTKEKIIVGGADDGSIAFWTVDHFKLCALWTVFLTPLTSVLQIDEKQRCPLSGCVLCISADGTIAVIAIDGFQFLYLVPGAAAPLCKVCLGSNNLLLGYANRRARLWDVQTKELRRSMSLDKVDELLDQGGWIDLSLSTNTYVPNTALKPAPGTSTGVDVASTLLLDLQRFTSESITVAKKISTNRDQTRSILLTLERLRSVLSTLLTPGLNDDIDGICIDRLAIQLSPKPIGFSSGGSVVLYNTSHSADPWCISSDVSAAHALSIVVLLRALSLFEEYMEGANTVMTFYATSLASSVGPYYQPPSLVFLANRWFDGSNEIRQAARFLFDYVAAHLSDEETSAITDEWQHHLPCLQPSADREAMHSALALFLCGYLASAKYSLLSTSALTDISKSIALYLHDEQSLHRVLAVDLCSRGFHIWQHYIDAMEILRALFSIAATPYKEAISVQNVGAQARLAILQISANNTALFMTTLGLDILTPPSLEHRQSVMQIVAFLIRRRPLVLQPNIPKLMEAVVKSLDPNVTTHRDAVLDTATEIIGHVVKTFPTVDFHMATQRLAVGSSDGAIVMYDLKTAIRLYVLEQHVKSVTACSFSPDGRRLLSLSLEESVVLVWKVGSSFTSLFNPGVPPRQGHSGSQPFKTIRFNVGDAANMSVAETLELVKVEWVADRSVKVKIKESVLTFST